MNRSTSRGSTVRAVDWHRKSRSQLPTASPMRRCNHLAESLHDRKAALARRANQRCRRTGVAKFGRARRTVCSPRARHAVERLERDFHRAKRILVPNLSDWTQTGKVLARLAAKYDYEQIGRGRLTNDALIATYESWNRVKRWYEENL